MSTRRRLALLLETPYSGNGSGGIEALCARVRAAEAAGVEIVWLADPQASGLSLHAAVAVASHTRVIRIGAQVSLAGAHPIRLAEDAASADGIAAGRLELCLRLDGDTDSKPLEETLAILRGGWSPGPVGPHGEENRLADVDIHPKPTLPEGPPLWIGETRGIQGAPGAAPLRSAQCEVGFIASSLETARIYLREWLALGRSPDRARLGVPLSPDPGEPEGAWEAFPAEVGEDVPGEVAEDRSDHAQHARERCRAELRTVAEELGGFGTVDGIVVHPLGQSAL